MQFVIDVHVHSRCARATSRDLNWSNLHKWSALKGVDAVGTGDYTHPEWFAELSAELEPAEDGLDRLRAPWRDAVERELPERCRREVRFMLSVEISTIYKKGAKTRKIHHIVILPCLDAVARLNQRLGAIGNLQADGRPILGLDSRDLLEICLEADPDALFVPAHIWTPHFAALGASYTPATVAMLREALIRRHAASFTAEGDGKHRRSVKPGRYDSEVDAAAASAHKAAHREWWAALGYA